jgi:hypothetical protein
MDVLKAEHHRAIGILDLAGRCAELNIGIGRLILFRETAFDLHLSHPNVLYIVARPINFSLGLPATVRIASICFERPPNR